MSKILVAEDEPVTRHLICKVLETAGFSVASAEDGVEALNQLKKESFDLVLLDIWMPRMNGLEVLARLKSEPTRPKVVVITSDDTPETLLRAVQEQAYRYVTKPVDARALVELVNDALATGPVSSPIEVLSARPDWVELLVPCEFAAADRIQDFLAHLDADLDEGVRFSVGMAFHELLRNAIEWGGQLDPTHKVQIAYLRFDRMLLYRITDPGQGFRFGDLDHAAVSNPPEDPIKHVGIREERGLRPGGFGILMARANVDELRYNESRNEVVFVKYLD